jgi:prepilin-type N-terminal cleavage/methylation domain-containing protein
MLNFYSLTPAHRCMHSSRSAKAGFTLIELSVVLIIISVIIGSGLTLLITGTQSAQYNSTIATMDAIEAALQNYVSANGRIPCPADLTIAKGGTNYGREAGYQTGGVGTGECVTGMTPAANFESSSGVEEGGVPARALNLPDSYMYDGWGRKFRYAVDPNQTIIAASHSNWTLPRGCTPAGGTAKPITVNDASGSARTTAAIYAIISHGPNEHGAYTSSGQIVNAGSINADEQTNCHCDNTGAHTGGAGVLASATYVQKIAMPNASSPLNSFDDIVAFKEAWQMQTQNNQITSACPTSYYRTVTIDHTKVPNTDQTNFPMLFSGMYSYLATVANGGLVQNINGYDITFTSDAAGTQLLPFEIESWSATTGQITAWIKVPAVSHSTDTTIYLQYGNSATTTDQSNKPGVWTNNYVLVQHLGESSGTSIADSTGNGHTGTKNTASHPAAAAGIIGNAQSFNGTSSDWITFPDTASMNFTSAQSYTISTWVNASSLTSSWQTIAEVSRSSGPWYGLWITSNNHWGLGGNYGQSQNIYGSAASTNSWHYLVGIQQGSVQRILYVDGASSATGSVDPGGSTSSGGGIGADDTTIYSGGTFPDEEFNGKIDEVRISNVARSADWTSTEYNNQGWPDKASTGLSGMSSGFYTVGAQQGSR